MIPTQHRTVQFPLGSAVTIAELDDDPYPVFARLRENEPVTWVPALNMWLVTGYDDVQKLLLDSANLITTSPRSPIVETFGHNMLTTEGADHDRYRRALQPTFMLPNIRQNLEAAIEVAAAELIAAMDGAETVEIRHAFAARLPIHVILITFGLPLSGEPLVRRWYDDFEKGLANFESDPAIKETAARSIGEFRAFLQRAVDDARGKQARTLLGQLTTGQAGALSVEEVIQNMLIVLFGGISTVEALLLNAVWALDQNRSLLARVERDRSLIESVIEETMRWLSPVQSATRYAISDQKIRGVVVQRGETVNLMLGAANRDPNMFPNPDQFDIDRPNLRRHLGFAAGTHHCLGFRLARAEASIGLNTLLNRFPDFHVVAERSERPRGCEFRQPRQLTLTSEMAA